VSLVLCVLALLIATAVGTVRGSCRCAVALIALAGVWLLANGPVEGPVLWAMDAQHGLTTADLLAIPYCLLAMRCLARSEAYRQFRASRVIPASVAPMRALRRTASRGPSLGPARHLTATLAPQRIADGDVSSGPRRIRLSTSPA
jgi:hypothetical protein